MTTESTVRKGYEWLLEHVEPRDWEVRRRNIQTQLLEVANPHSSPIGSQDFRSGSVADDRIGWYLYLAETFLDRRDSYEPIQGARVIPIFAQLGAHLELLARIGGIKDKCAETINAERRNPDAGLFEILTALMYAQNGWPTVELIPRSPSEKRPDIRVADGRLKRKRETFALTSRLQLSNCRRAFRRWSTLALKLWTAGLWKRSVTRGFAGRFSRSMRTESNCTGSIVTSSNPSPRPKSTGNSMRRCISSKPRNTRGRLR
jgi:hypothetical protein